jgi:hypothetical protein
MKRIIYIIVVILFFYAMAAEAQIDTIRANSGSIFLGEAMSGTDRSISISIMDPIWFEIGRDDRLYERLNVIRKDHGLKPLSHTSVLELKAARWLKKMHLKYYSLTHDRASKEAELLTDCADPLTCWMRSAAHRKVLLSKEYTKIGIVFVEGDWCARLTD